MARPRVQPDDDRNAEAALVARAAAGDQAAFADLVIEHRDEVFTLALRLTSDWNRAHEVTQEAFVRAWKSLPRFRGESRLSTWLHRITVNVAWTHGKRRKRDNDRTAPLDDGAALPNSTLGSPETEMGRSDLRARLLGALDRLSPDQRVVVVLKDIEGWSHEEIASHTGITITAAKVRLHRARAKLRNMLWEEAP